MSLLSDQTADYLVAMNRLGLWCSEFANQRPELSVAPRLEIRPSERTGQGVFIATIEVDDGVSEKECLAFSTAASQCPIDAADGAVADMERKLALIEARKGAA